MGKSSKKKKRGHGGSARKSKDYAAHSGDEADIIMEELTVLEATYQEDLKIVSKSPFVVNLNIRPYSRDTGFDDLDMSAILSVRYIPGYPNKCPKFHITPGEGLSEEDASRLLSLLQDQAIVNAREGRVMIFNLVEAAKEFLSAIVPQGQSTEFVSNTIIEKKDHLVHEDMETSGDNTHYFRGPFVYGLVDLFIGYKDSWNWDHGTEKIRSGNPSVVDHSLDPLNIGYQPSGKKVLKNEKSLNLKDPKKNSTQPPPVKLDSLREERETDSGSTSNDSNGSDSEESVEHGIIIEDQEESTLEDSKYNDSDLEDKPSSPLTSIKYDQESSWTMKKDLIMVHLLRLACASKGPLSDYLQEISSELYCLGLFSECAKDLAAKPLQIFKEDFVNSFGEHMGSSLNPQFWDSSDLEVSASRPSSRYHNDFEEIASLGHGGFGHVSLCRNKLDGRQYAVKRIPLEDKSLTLNDRILREVATLSRLQHQHVVRFYQAWVETEVGAGYNDLTWGSRTASSSGYSLQGSSSTYVVGTDNKQESTFLYIQMEYCPRTLRQVFESYGSVFGKELAWHLFRQIVEGLAHIHAQGIIHRDLTPNNIFFDARNDIKIGDFGLAKFLKLEQLDHEPNPIGTTDNTVDGTGHVGTYFYTAPEIEQEWPMIDEKADMYSLGVVFFELWHPFNTAMERHVVLSDLKNKWSPPTPWVAEYPEQAALLRRLMSPSPSNRPSTKELLQHDLPPRMEDEWLDDVLRAIQSPEDTRVYEKVVQKIFDEERLAMKALHQRSIKVNLGKEDSFFSQCTELETEIRDHVVEVAKGAFRQHCAKRLETTLLNLLDDSPQFHRNAVKLLTKDGDVLELCHEMRLPFVSWIVTNQKSSFRRYEISWVYRNSIGHSTPNRYLQGDFDIVGGAVSVTEAEIIKVAMDIVTSFFHSNSCHIRLNHAYLLDAVWCWVGVEADLRESVAQCLSVMGSLCPQSSKRKSSWTLVRRQLLQDLKLAEGVVNRLQTVDSRFCGYADQALPRLMGALPPDRRTRKALEELSALFSYLRIWKIEKNVFVDALMLPAENYHRGIFFQVFSDGTLLAVGGRYDHLLYQMWDPEHKSLPPGAVGISLALENIVCCSTVENKPSRSEVSIEVLVCSRGGGGMLNERMELVSELWQANIKAAFVPIPEPSLTEQYEYAAEHGIKCLIIITEAGLSQTGLIKVRHLELKKEKEVKREKLVEFLTNAATSQFRNISGRN